MRYLLPVMLLALTLSPALAAEPTPQAPSLTAKDAQELQGILISGNITYKGSDLAEVGRLLNLLSSIANPPVPAPKH